MSLVGTTIVANPTLPEETENCEKLETEPQDGPIEAPWISLFAGNRVGSNGIFLSYIPPMGKLEKEEEDKEEEKNKTKPQPQQDPKAKPAATKQAQSVQKRMPQQMVQVSQAKQDQLVKSGVQSAEAQAVTNEQPQVEEVHMTKEVEQVKQVENSSVVTPSNTLMNDAEKYASKGKATAPTSLMPTPA
ncbi:hypothetical protein K7X08_028596 [Anisodus acutangulus]|uniref:Uncharacterized protein n=1 Tax=Anisodus acutangulus TaxID=402998 RepID=A0A9Q1R9A7_9SOLA|nr:hypothetical protein K7X08_028596 [Anisodus acutangulus]